MDNINYMQIALEEAKKAGQKDEVPIGAIIVAENGDILSAAHNLAIRLVDPTAHAEILALRKAAHRIQNYRLLNTTLFSTIEPCPMCMGAILNARVAKIVFGAKDPKWGAAGSLYNFATDQRFNHRIEVVSGICRDECRSLLQNFFRERRKKE
jgi:tRNA(adenine34) deaminase